jgi:hypothetical protein
MMEVGTLPVPGALAVGILRELKFHPATKSARAKVARARVANATRYAQNILAKPELFSIFIMYKAKIALAEKVKRARVTIE